MTQSKLLKRVEASLKWKKSNSVCARRLNIDLDTYLLLKRQLVSNINPTQDSYSTNVNLETGTTTIEYLSTSNPKTPEEIIDLLNIDTNNWKLSQYWNKQRGDKWLISALVTQIKKTEEDLLKDLISNFKPEYYPIDKIKRNNNLESVSAVLSVQDIHFGKHENANIAEDYFKAVESLLTKSTSVYTLDKLYYVIGGDLLNVDTFTGTTTSGTVIGTYPTAQDMYKEAFDSLYNSIRFMSMYVSELHVVYIPGNHDRLSSYHLAHALSKSVREENITWSVDYAERKVFTDETNFFAFEHGDTNTKNSLLVYATENPEEWGKTRYRTLYTGHYHKKKTIEYITEDEYSGFSIKILPSLSKTDYWHHHNKFIGNKRSAVIDIHSKQGGKLAEFVYNAI
jgi:hypothetical protein